MTKPTTIQIWAGTSRKKLNRLVYEGPFVVPFKLNDFGQSLTPSIHKTPGKVKRK